MPARAQPYVGMRVRVMHLGHVEKGVVTDVAEQGRALTVDDGHRYTLRRINGRFVREGDPSYGVRLVFEPQQGRVA